MELRDTTSEAIRNDRFLLLKHRYDELEKSFNDVCDQRDKLQTERNELLAVLETAEVFIFAVDKRSETLKLIQAAITKAKGTS